MIYLNSQRRAAAALKGATVLGLSLVLGLFARSAQAQEETVSFANDVWPIFVERCVECHGPEKVRAGLRLDSPEAIQEGSDFGPVITAGEPDNSLLFELITLPPDDDTAMPGEGEPLTDEQIATIKSWITQGAGLSDWDAAVHALDAGEDKKPDPLVVLAEGVEPAPENALAAVRETGAIAMPLGMSTPLLRVNLQLQGDDVTDETLQRLTPLAEQITWLNLAGTAVTDAGLENIAKLKKLTKLHLERTAITDAGLEHLKGLENLQYLNLYDTEVTDAGIEQLKGLENLHSLYVWQTGVTADGADMLKEAIPGLAVNTGVDLEPAVESESEQAAAETEEAGESFNLARFFDEGSCCAKAHAEGKECEHECCKTARAENTVCTKCNPGAEAKLALVKLFDEGSCCAQAHAEGKDCSHPCCQEAWAKGEVCAKCNPGAAEKAAKAD